MAFALTTGSIALTVAGGAFFKTMGAVGGVLTSVNSQIEKVTANTKRMFLAVTGFATVAVRTYGTYERAMRQATAATNIAEEEFRRLYKFVESESIKVNIAAVQAAGGIRELGFAGLSAAEMFEAFPPLLKLSKAGMADMGLVSEKVLAVMGAYELEIKEIGKVTDFVAKLWGSSRASLEQLADTMGYAAIDANDVGMSMAELGATIRILAEAGIKSSRAGTSLRRMFTNLTAPTTAVQQMLDKLGVTIDAGAGKLRPYMEILQDVFDAAARGTEIERRLASRILFGQRAISSATKLFKKGKQVTIEYTKALEDAGGTVDIMVKRQMKSFLEQLGVVWRRIKRLTRTIGEFLAPAVKRLGEVLGTATDKLNTFLESHKLDVQEWAENWALRILYVKDILWGVAKWIATDWRTAVMDALKSTLPLWEAFAKSLGYIWLKMRVDFLNVLADMANANRKFLMSISGPGGKAILQLIMPEAEKLKYTWGDVGRGIAAEFGMAARDFKPPKAILDIEKRARETYNKASLELQEKYEKLRMEQAGRVDGIPDISRPQPPGFHAPLGMPLIPPEAAGAAEAARTGFVGIREAWKQIAEGTKRTEEEHLRISKKALEEEKKQTPLLEKIAERTVETGVGY